MWQITKQDVKKKYYTNNTTGISITLSNVYTDREGNTWWAFDDLMTVPYTRSFAATKVSSLYSVGLSKDDISNHVNELKKILKGNDADKYERAYAETLNFESKAANGADAIKQMTSLVCVYFLLNDEAVDAFTNDIQQQKLTLIENDPAMHGFFLKLLMNLTESYTKRLSQFSQIVSLPELQNEQ